MKMKYFNISRQREVNCIYVGYDTEDEEVYIKFLRKNKKEDWEILGFFEDTIAEMKLINVKEKNIDNICENLEKICNDTRYEEY